MKIAALSDMHGRFAAQWHPEVVVISQKMPEADVLVLGGDYLPNFTRMSHLIDADQQLMWLEQVQIPFLKTLPYKKIIVIAGNHDWCHYLKETKDRARALVESVGVYLEDSSLEYEGVKFYGSPWTPKFYDWAFMFSEHDHFKGYTEARKTWEKIPAGTDVLVTHGPPHKILDRAPDGRDCGCMLLRDRVIKIKPKLHLFGHIHGGYGIEEKWGTRFGNIALCDEDYAPTQPIQVFEV